MLLAVFLVTLVQALERCPACSTTGKDVRLCAPHAEEERSFFTRAGKRLGSKDPAERIAGLEELAGLTRGHVNAPSRRVAERLASAFEDESYALRERVTELLGPPQNALVSLPALLAAFRACEDERGRLEKEGDRLHARRVGRPEPRESKLEELSRAEAANERQKEPLLGWRTALLQQLARFPDDRVVETILELAPRDLVLGGNEALLQLGSRKALQAVVESVRVWEEKVAWLEKDIAEMEKGAADPLIAGVLEPFRSLLEQTLAEGNTHQPQLIRLAEERGLVPVPQASNRPHEGWKRWLETHIDALPAQLPGVSSPVW